MVFYIPTSLGVASPSMDIQHDKGHLQCCYNGMVPLNHSMDSETKSNDVMDNHLLYTYIYKLILAH